MPDQIFHESMNQQRSSETVTGMWCILGGAGARVTLLFLLQWRKINICLTVADHWKIEWISSGSQISSSFIVVQAELRVGVRVKFRGWRSDEGQGYGQVRVTVRSKYPTPLGQHLSGHCLPLRPVKKMWLYDVQHSHWHETLFCNYATILTIVSVTIQHKC